MKFQDRLWVVKRLAIEEYVYDQEILASLFKKAQEKDEAEFCCTLLRIRGKESAGWDSLDESYKFIEGFLSLINSPLESMFKMRMLLLMYSHITEMDDFYSIIANLLWVMKGTRYSADPFNKQLYDDKQDSKSPYSKVERIKVLSKEVGFDEIGRMYEYLLVKQMRNAFYHSDFVLYNDQFRITHGKGVLIDGGLTNSIPLQWIVNKIEFTINLFLQLMILINEYRDSYTEDKVIECRMGHNDEQIKVALLGGERGLYGIKSI